MSFALSSGVAGLQAHQRMLDVAGNNLANTNTTAYKTSSVNFAETLSQTIETGSGPRGDLGGINPQQIGSGVSVSSIMKNLSQGNINSTGRDLDMAIEGSGYFVMSDGNENIYTRIGSFAKDSANYLIDPSTGYRLQRIGSTGEVEGFQTSGDSGIRVPDSMIIPPEATSSITMNGNLRQSVSTADSTETTLSMRLSTVFRHSSTSDFADETTALGDLDKCSGTWTAVAPATGPEAIELSGYDFAGNSISTSIAVNEDTTLGSIITAINSNFSGMTASLENGQLVVEADAAGYTKGDVRLAFVPDAGAGAANIDIAKYMTIEQAGGNDEATTSVELYDSVGGKHTVGISYVKTDTPNTWDAVITNVTGNTYDITDRRIEGVTFNSDGSFGGLDTIIGDESAFGIAFSHEPTVSQKIDAHLGVEGGLAGLTSFPSNGSESTLGASRDDGYTVGTLNGVSFDNGMVVGSFSNDLRVNIAAIQLAVFTNSEGLESVGNGYYKAGVNSGEPIATQAGTGGAGSITGGALEGSNVDTAIEFVNLMQAQNGFQANARTIQVANEVLRELTNLIR